MDEWKDVTGDKGNDGRRGRVAYSSEDAPVGIMYIIMAAEKSGRVDKGKNG